MPVCELELQCTVFLRLAVPLTYILKLFSTYMLELFSTYMLRDPAVGGLACLIEYPFFLLPSCDAGRTETSLSR